MRRLMALMAAVSLPATACGFGPSATWSGGDPGPANRPVVVNVTNSYGLPVEVYAVGAGTSYRMGTVSPGIASRFVLRQAMLATSGVVEFVAQPAGTERPVRSGGILLRYGDVVDFEVTTHLLASYATVRP